MKSVDVAVVGAGPAGATAARLLAARGLDVVLFEREPLPRYKACGGGVTAGALPLLPPGVAGAARAVASGAEVRYGGTHVRVAAPGPAVWLYLRDELDWALVEAARAAGCRVLDRRPARVTSQGADGVLLEAGGEAWRARYAVVATGAAAGWDGPPPPLAAAVEAELEAGGASSRWADRLVGDFDAIPRGYGWVFPKGGILSVGVATWGTGVRAVRAVLERYLERLGLARLPRLRQRGHPIPVGGARLVPWRVRGRVLRAGDAAALADPLFGEGIRYAARSGHLAAEAVARACAGGGEEALGRYAEALRREVEPALARLALAARLFHPLAPGWVRLAATMPRLADRFFALVTGATSVGSAEGAAGPPSAPGR